MGKVLHSILYCILIFSAGRSVAKSNDSSNIEFQKLLNNYIEAYNKSDFSLLDNDVINQQEYNAIISKVLVKNKECLTDFDKNYDVNIFKRAFEKSHLSRIKSDSIVINKISDFNTCSELEIKKITCFVYFKKSNTSVPITLIVIKSEENKYKILLDIINENYFSNAKN